MIFDKKKKRNESFNLFKISFIKMEQSLKFISNIKELLYKTWYTQYFKDGWHKKEEITDLIIQ